MRFLSSYGQNLSAGIVQHSNFFINSDKNAHFSQLDLVNVEIADIVSIVSSCDMPFVVDIHQAEVMKASCTEKSLIDR